MGGNGGCLFGSYLELPWNFSFFSSLLIIWGFQRLWRSEICVFCLGHGSCSGLSMAALSLSAIRLEPRAILEMAEDSPLKLLLPSLRL